MAKEKVKKEIIEPEISTKGIETQVENEDSKSLKLAESLQRLHIKNRDIPELTEKSDLKDVIKVVNFLLRKIPQVCRQISSSPLTLYKLQLVLSSRRNSPITTAFCKFMLSHTFSPLVNSGAKEEDVFISCLNCRNTARIRKIIAMVIIPQSIVFPLG